MDNKPIVLLQQRDFGQKMNASFDFVGKNFKPLFKALLFIAGPSALLTGIAQGIFQSRILAINANSFAPSPFRQYWAVEYLFVIIFSSITYFLSYATVSAFISLYEENGSSEQITPGVVWNKMAENIGASLGASFLYFLLVLIGIFFFFIPGIYLSVALQFFMIITIREKLGAVDALKKSRQLIKDKWWSTFGLIVIMSFVAGIISIVFQLPVFITTIFSALGLAKEWGSMKGWLIFGSALSILGTSIVQGLVWIALAFQYYNLEEINSGSGLLSDIESLGNGDWERPKGEDQY
jgi:hypothetical protein